MATLSVQNIAKTGLAVSYVNAAGGGDEFVDNGRQETFLEVVNGSGGSINATIEAVKTAKTVDGVGPITVPDIIVVVPASGRRMIGPFPSAYIDAGGIVAVAYSAATSVTVAAIRCAKIDA